MRVYSDLNVEERKEVVRLLRDTFKKFKTIAKECGISLSSLYSINKGESKHYNELYDGTFPIRFTNEEKEKLIIGRHKQGATTRELMKEFNMARTTLEKITSRGAVWIKKK